MKKHFVKSAESFGAKRAVVKTITLAVTVAMLGVTGCGSKTTDVSKETPAKASSVAAESSAETEEAAASSETTEEDTKVTEEVEEEEETEETEKETEEETEEETDQVAETTEDQEKVEEDTAGMSGEVLKNKSGRLVNGNFASGLDYFTIYAYEANNMDYTVSGSQGLNVTIYDTGTEDWHVQLKQDGIKLVQGNWYRLTLDAKSSMARTIGCAMQRDGSNDNNWALYSNASRLALGSNWETYTLIFQMNEQTDTNALFNLSLGTVDGARITSKHSVGIKNISLTQLDANWMDNLKTDGNLLGNTDFAYGDTLWDAGINGSAKGSITLKNGTAVVNIQDPGELDWHVQIKQAGIKLKQNCGYRLTFKATSTEMRKIKVGFMDTNYVTWYGGGDLVIGPNAIIATTEFYNRSGDNDNALLMISMGMMDTETPASTIVISDIKLEEVPNMAPKGGAAAPAAVSGEAIPTGWSVNCGEGNGTVAYTGADDTFKFDITNPGVNEWDVQLKNSGFTLEKGSKYHVTYTITSTESRLVKFGYFSQSYAWYAGADLNLVKDVPMDVDMTFAMDSATDTNALVQFSMGQMYEDYQYTLPVDTAASTITISNYKLEKLEEVPVESDALLTGTMTKKGDEVKFNYGQFVEGGVAVGDTVTLVATFSSDADSWGGGFGGADLEAQDHWKQVQYNKGGKTVTLTLKVDQLENGGVNDYAQAQIWWPDEGDVNITFELISVTKEATEPGEEENAPLLTGTLVRKGENFGFTYGEFVEDLQVGDHVTLVARVSADTTGWGGGFGAADARESENWWKQVQFSDSATEVTLEIEAGATESGEINPYAQAQIWWPDEGDVNITFELLSVTKTVE